MNRQTDGTDTTENITNCYVILILSHFILLGGGVGRTWWRRPTLSSQTSRASSRTSRASFSVITLSSRREPSGGGLPGLLEQRVLRDSNYTRRPDVLFNKYPFHNGTRLAKIYVRENMHPPSWKTYTEHWLTHSTFSYFCLDFLSN